MLRRIHSILLLFVLLLGCAGMNYVQAAVYNGNCGANGSNVKWSLNTSTGVLSITGSGAMANYLSTDGTNTDISTAPWYNYRSSITTITIQSGVTTIGNYAFRAAAVQQVTIPSTITTIGEYAFFNTSYLKNISVPSSVTSIGAYAYGYAGRSTTENQTLSISNSVTSMGRGAFFKCSRLVTVTMGTGVKAIPQDCFYECTALQTITLPSALKTIGESAFNGCTALKTVSFPSTLTTIGPYAFKQIGNATTANQTISIPNSVTSMGRGAFFKCARLKTITFGTGVKAVPQDCCYQSTNLQTISFSSTLTSIGESAFNGCTALTTVEFPATLTTFSPNTFLNCTALANIYVNWTSNIPTWNTVTNNSGITLHVPCGTKALYQAATGWKNYTIAGVTTLQTITCTCGTGGKVKIDNGTAGTNVTKQASCDANVKLTATASTGYHFVQWNDGNTTNPRTVLVAGAKTYTASFTKNQYTLTVKTATNNTTQGTVKISNGTAGASANATIVHGASTTITATPATGYHFVQWNDGNTTNPRSITMTGNATYTATFAINTYTLTAKTNNSSYGKVKIDDGTANATVSKTVNHGASVTITAVLTTTNCNIDFLQWNDGVKDNPRTVTVDATITYTAQFGTIGGNCGANGNNLTWSFNRCTGVLTISGSGAMADWGAEADVPWYKYRGNITSIVLPYGLTHIGDYAFRKTSITKIDLPSALQTIGKYAFSATPLIEVCIPEGVTSIGEKAFISGSEYACLMEACNAPLRRVYLPSTLTELGNASIALAHLEYLTYPKSITTLGHTYYHKSQYPAKELYASWTTNIPSRTGPIASITTPKQQMHIPYGTTAAYRAKDWERVHDLVEDVDERAIDLGLSIRWASCNIGATAPEESGEYYMWADTLGGWSSYVMANYPYYKNGYSTRYNETDHRTRLIPFDDVAYIRWGETWRMPTKDEWHELFTQCTWEKEKLNDVWVYKVTGPNGNYIYIPLPGYIQGTFHSPEADGYYWTSELYSSGSPIATSISSGGARNSGPANPSYGISVRAVYRREWPSFTLTITDTPEGTSYTKAINAGSTYTLTAQEDDCHTFVRWSDGNTNKTRTVTATADATYTAVYDTEQFTVTVQAEDPTMGDVSIIVN